jgi:L-ascorbate metabolism protein UlaG (beta-lactamase superfamily)
MSSVRVTHIGGPTVLLEIDGWRILTDPTFDNPGRKYHFGWGTGSRKVTGPAIPLDDLGRIDAVLLTHDHHADNLDDAGRALLPSSGVVVTTSSGAQRLGSGTRGLDPWGSTRLDGADVVGFALRWDGQEHGVLWISGDTVLYDGVRQVAGRFSVGLALLHLGSAQFPVTGPVRYTMTARDAINLCRLVRPRTAIPVHFEGWSHFREGRSAIEEELEAASVDIRGSFQLLTLGTGIEFLT